MPRQHAGAGGDLPAHGGEYPAAPTPPPTPSDCPAVHIGGRAGEICSTSVSRPGSGGILAESLRRVGRPRSDRDSLRQSQAEWRLSFSGSAPPTPSLRRLLMQCGGSSGCRGGLCAQTPRQSHGKSLAPTTLNVSQEGDNHLKEHLLRTVTAEDSPHCPATP
jgi:hypothetical protein